MELSPARFDELVREIFADTEILAESAGIRVTLDDCEAATVNGDAHRLRQLLLNLVDNAVKYNRSGGAISIALRCDCKTAELSVANSGPGIAPEKLPRVFERFFRGDSAHGSDTDGCGLGLSIAQWIVSAHNGTIKLNPCRKNRQPSSCACHWPANEL